MRESTANHESTETPRVTLKGVWSRLRHSRLAGALTVGVLAFLSLGAWSLSSPVGSNPDADYHLASIWCTGWGEDPCAMEERRNQKMVPSALVEARCYAQDPFASAGCQPLMTTLDERETMTNRLNTVKKGYPSGFYLVQHTLAGDNIEASVIGIRLLNSGLFVVLNVVLWWFLPLRLRAPLVFAWVATMVPLGMFIVPSTNPSSWAVIGVGSAWIALLGYLEEHSRTKWLLGGLFLLFAGLAAMARTDATLFAVATSGLALFVTDAPFRQIIRRLWIPAVGVVLAGLVLVFQSGALGTLWAGFRTTENTGFNSGLLWNNIIETPGLWMGALGAWPWGSLGWLDTPMPQLVAFMALGVFLALLGLGFSGATVRVRLVTTLMLLMMWAIPVYILQISDFLVGAGFQSRYGLPLLVVLMGIVVVRSGTVSLGLQRIHLVMMTVALSIANSIALHHNIRRYVTGLDERGLNLDSGREWWWWTFQDGGLSPMGVWILGSLAFFGAVWVALVAGMAPTEKALAVTGETTKELDTDSEPEEAQSDTSAR